MTQYKELTLPTSAKTSRLLLSIANSGLADQFMIYEKPGEWSLGMGNLLSIDVYKNEIVVKQEDRIQIMGYEDFEPALTHITQNLPVENWRLYGQAKFELAYVFYGLTNTISLDKTNKLMSLFIPEYEVRVSDKTATLRATSPAGLEKLVELFRLSERREKHGYDTDFVIEHVDLTIPSSCEYYKTAVQQAIADIQENHYQKVILSRQVQVSFPLDMAKSYEYGRQKNTPARSFILRQSGFEAAGFCPETVLEASPDGWVSTQPLAGTRSLGNSPEEELQLKSELISTTKEIAEHAISVRLAYEELDQVCDEESLSVCDFMSIKRRGSVQHLASRVKGKLSSNHSVWDAFKALFPAVTASGIPKKESLLAIKKYEASERALYSGSVMIVDPDGAMDAGLVLRSIYKDEEKCWLQAGAGIVDQSLPERELTETIEKLSCIAQYLVQDLKEPMPSIEQSKKETV
ncbi:2,3-dihydroxybenzoate-AMP ligase [pyochelin] siderophore [Grimontia indica]|uniref:2,3-dihydroxybenzoate-AMP ligase [pyochelin] siderophore n=1 Tax=Grimontia indica TaxID=1056512 RepID=R1I8P4_9GAMM|nr:salicylate synthase [Grimontia indica]EOD77061.1 2,3-dihydroxybenzoate-AMP ligase [pyochelin] siderophore [Grimontia indica]